MRETLQELESIRRDLTAAMLDLDGIIGEVRLRLRGLEEAVAVADALETQVLPAGWRIENGQPVYSAAWLDRMVAS